MKFTNVKQLIIKFMGGGLINLPTRFLRWIKIDGDAEGDDGGDGSGDSESLLMSLIPNDYPKPDLFLFRRSELDNNPIDVSNYKIDDFINLSNEIDNEIDNDLQIISLYKNSNLSGPIIRNIAFFNNGYFGFSVNDVRQYIRHTEITYNNENYSYYERGLV